MCCKFMYCTQARVQRVYHHECANTNHQKTCSTQVCLVLAAMCRVFLHAAWANNYIDDVIVGGNK